MNSNGTGEITHDCTLNRFERNRWFHGKLVTARDLNAAWRYHADRSNTLTRFVTGEGIVCGLESRVEQNEETGELTVTVQRGIALDCCGRPVVVANPTPNVLPAPGEDVVHLYLTYDECLRETVPVPGAENACEENCEYNRILEIFDVEYGEAPSEDHKAVGDIEFPDSDALADDEGAALFTMARSYFEEEVEGERRLRACEPCDGPSIFLGTFAESGGTWSRDETVDRRFAYVNDMLYAAVARHATAFGNPHEVTAEQSGALVSVEGVENPGGDVDLDSPDGNVSFTTDTDVVGENTVGLSVPGLDDLEEDVQAHLEDTDNPHEVTAEQTGALASVEGVAGDADGNVDLASPDDTVSITTDSDAVGENAVGLSVTGLAELEERHREDVASLTERLDELAERHRADVDRLTDRLIRIERYVMERSVWCKCRSFSIVIERFENQRTAARISRAAREFLGRFEAGERIEPGEYYDYLEGVLELQEQLIEELERNAGPQPGVRTALEELRSALDRRDEENVLPAAAAQNKACILFTCVHPIVID